MSGGKILSSNPYCCAAKGAALDAVRKNFPSVIPVDKDYVRAGSTLTLQGNIGAGYGKASSASKATLSRAADTEEKRGVFPGTFT